MTDDEKRANPNPKPLRCFSCATPLMRTVLDRRVHLHECPNCRAAFAVLIVTGEDGASREMKIIGELLDIEKGSAK